MSEIMLAGNLVSGISISGLGHLQLVYVNGSEEREIEVQSGPFVTLGNWQYPTIPRDHPDNTPYYGDTDRYKATSLEQELGGRDPDDVWDVLKAIHAEFFDKGTGINYDLFQNSNSYINSLLYMIGITLDDDLIARAKPDDVGNSTYGPFPGSTANVIL
jgi:hypothetical protein